MQNFPTSYPYNSSASSGQSFHQEMLFFPSPQNERKIVELLKAARKTIDLCLYLLTNKPLTEAVESAVRERKVKVRLIIDDKNIDYRGSTAQRLLSIGALKTHYDQRANMHHKFCIIDDHVVMFGSFNWTQQAVTMNYENLLITNDPEIVSNFSNEYTRLWKMFYSLGQQSQAIQDNETKKLQKAQDRGKRNKKSKSQELTSNHESFVHNFGLHNSRRQNFEPKKASQMRPTASILGSSRREREQVRQDAIFLRKRMFDEDEELGNINSSSGSIGKATKWVINKTEGIREWDNELARSTGMSFLPKPIKSLLSLFGRCRKVLRTSRN